jgi:hypothetical protein
VGTHFEVELLPDDEVELGGKLGQSAEKPNRKFGAQ